MANYNGVHVREYQSRGVWYVQLWWYVGQGSKRGSAPVGRKAALTKTVIAQARRKQEQVLALQPGRIGAGDAPTWGAWRKQYLELRPELSAGSVKLVKQACDYFTVWLEKNKTGDSTRLDQISRADVATFRQNLASRKVANRSVSPQTVVKHVRLLACMFGAKYGALKLDLIPFNPFDRETTHVAMGSPKGHPDLTGEQTAALLDACPSTAWRSMVATCIYAGARVGETFLLAWEDVYWGGGKIKLTSEKVRGKQSVRRDCKMEPELEKVLLEGFEAGDSKPVTLSKNNLNRDMIAAIERAGLVPWSGPFQGLRRWRDSTWKLKYPEYVVDAWMGHGVEVSRKHYLTVPEHLYTPCDKLDRIIDTVKSLSKHQLDELEEILGEFGATSAQHGKKT